MNGKKVTRSRWLCGAGAALVLLPCVAIAQSSDADLERRVRDVHAAARPLDAHVDVLVPTTPEIYRTGDGVSQVTVEKLLAGGLATVTLALQSPTGPTTAEGIAAARAEVDAKLARIHAIAEANRDRLALALGSADIERIHAEGKIAILIGFQNAYALGTDLSPRGPLRRRRRARVRVQSCGQQRILGLVAAGDPRRRAARRALSARTVGRAKAQRSWCRHRRLPAHAEGRHANLGVVARAGDRKPLGGARTDRRNAQSARRGNGRDCGEWRRRARAAVQYLSRATAAGVRGEARTDSREFGLPEAFRGVLDDTQRLQGDARGEYTRAALESVPRATIEDYLNHIDYVVKRIGVEHVGIGTDFDHGAGIVGFKDASEAPNLTRGLLARGYSAEDIGKIWSGNFMRVLKAAEAAAAR